MNLTQIEDWINYRESQYMILEERLMKDVKRGDDDFTKITVESIERECYLLHQGYNNMLKDVTKENFDEMLRLSIGINEILVKYDLIKRLLFN